MSHASRTASIAATMILALFVVDAASAQGRGSGQGRSQGSGAGQAQAQQQGRGGSAQPGPGGNAQQGAGAQQGPARGGPAQAQQAAIRDRLRSRDIYGGDLMSDEERRQYRDRVNAASSDREWAQMRAEHMNEIRARAQAQGRPLDPPVYGEHMLTRQERNEFRDRVQSAESAAARERIQTEHREMIRERALLLGLDPPPID